MRQRKNWTFKGLVLIGEAGVRVNASLPDLGHN
jgi:hypothetical protein